MRNIARLIEEYHAFDAYMSCHACEYTSDTILQRSQGLAESHVQVWRRHYCDMTHMPGTTTPYSHVQITFDSHHFVRHLERLRVQTHMRDYAYKHI